MCLAKAFADRDGDREFLLEDVVRIDIRGPMLRLSTLFGDEEEIEAAIVSVDFQDGSVIIEGPSGRSAERHAQDGM